MATISFVANVAAADEYIKMFEKFNSDTIAITTDTYVAREKPTTRVVRQSVDVASALSALVKGNVQLLVIPEEFASNWILNAAKVPNGLVVEFSAQFPVVLRQRIINMLVKCQN